MQQQGVRPKHLFAEPSLKSRLQRGELHMLQHHIIPPRDNGPHRIGGAATVRNINRLHLNGAQPQNSPKPFHAALDVIGSSDPQGKGVSVMFRYHASVGGPLWIWRAITPVNGILGSASVKSMVWVPLMYSRMRGPSQRISYWFQ